MRGMSEPGRGSDFARLEATVTGLVQGVTFRWFTQRSASGLGLTGYVRNNPDGSVQVVAEGPRLVLEQLLADLKVGPSGAIVEDVETRWSAARREFNRFQIRY